MIEQTLKKIEKQIENSKTINDKNKTDLLKLISTLKSEILQLSQTHHDDAQSITSFTELTTHEMTRKDKKPQLMKISLDGLTASVEELESSHPKLAGIVNSIIEILSNIGI